MKETQVEKRKADLDRIEAELCRLLIKHLPGAMDGDCLFFFNSALKPPEWEMPDRYIRDYQEEILELANQSLALRRELILPTENTSAALFLAACTESASGNKQKRGPRRLAKWLLDQLHFTERPSDHTPGKS
jgi:hypothetical protein